MASNLVCNHMSDYQYQMPTKQFDLLITSMITDRIG